MARTIKCEMCGAIFQSPRANVKYCSDACRREAKYDYPSVKRRNGEVTTPSSSLAKTNQAAREAGMSYGKYVGMLWLKEHQW